MSVSLLIILVLYLLFHFIYAGNFFIDGPAEVHFAWIRDCPEYKNKDLPIKMRFTVHKVNRTIQVVDVNATFLFPIGNTVSVYIKSERWGAGGWMKNAFSLKEPNVCFLLNTLIGDLWFDIQKRIGMEPGKCPLPVGNYFAKDTLIDLQRMGVQTFMYGKFKTLVKLFRGTELGSCTILELELKEKLLYN